MATPTCATPHVPVHRLGLLLLLVVCAWGWAPRAQAATVRTVTRAVDNGDDPVSYEDTIDVVDAGGERNALTFSRTPDGSSVLISDAVPLTVAGGGLTDERCIAIGPLQVRCAVTGAGLFVDAGAGDDTVVFAAAPHGWSGEVHGGAGNDVLRDENRGRPCDRFLVFDGDAGDDRLTGAGVFVLSRGRDTIHRTPSCRSDLATADPYSIHPALEEPFAVDLRAGRATLGTSRTIFTGFSRYAFETGTVRGTDGPDHLGGAPFGDGDACPWYQAGRARGLLDGRGGDDVLCGSGRLIGGAGDDQIGVLGNSTVQAGPGADRITVAADTGRLSCGTGYDLVNLQWYTVTALSPDCEDVTGAGGTRIGSRPVLHGDHARLRARCPRHTNADCVGRVSVGDTATTTPFHIPTGRRRTLEIALSPDSIRPYHGRIPVTVIWKRRGPATWWISPRRG